MNVFVLCQVWVWLVGAAVLGTLAHGSPTRILPALKNLKPSSRPSAATGSIGQRPQSVQPRVTVKQPSFPSPDARPSTNPSFQSPLPPGKYRPPLKGVFQSGDPFTLIRDQPDNVLCNLAESFELRARDPQQVEIRRKILSKMHGRVVEIGSGTGTITRSLAEENPNVESIIGIDPSPKFVEKARSYKEHSDKIEYMEAFSTKLPLEDSSVGSVYFWTTLSHIPEKERTASLNEAFRVLKPGGSLHVFDNYGAGWRLNSGPYDPLQVVLDRMLDIFAKDRNFIWKVPDLMQATGFVGADSPSTLMVTDTTRESYGFRQILVYGLGMLRADGMDDSIVDALAAEADRRVQAGEFRLHQAYGYVSAWKPISESDSKFKDFSERHDVRHRPSVDKDPVRTPARITTKYASSAAKEASSAAREANRAAWEKQATGSRHPGNGHPEYIGNGRVHWVPLADEESRLRSKQEALYLSGAWLPGEPIPISEALQPIAEALQPIAPSIPNAEALHLSGGWLLDKRELEEEEKMKRAEERRINHDPAHQPVMV